MAKRVAPKHREFESRTERGKFIKICEDMMDSPAWKALNRSQRYLYIELKRKYTARTVNGVVAEDNSRNISLPKAEALTLYSNLQTFRGDIDCLIAVGLIDLVQSGWNTRSVNIYGFSERWKRYGLCHMGRVSVRRLSLSSVSVAIANAKAIPESSYILHATGSKHKGEFLVFMWYLLIFDIG